MTTLSSPSPAPIPPSLDHIVVLVPHSFLTSPPDWFGTAFSFAAGGRHADGLTENTLALLADGVYLEFIAFTPDAGADPSRRLAHRWGRQVEGTVIDWALTLHALGDDGDDAVKRQKEAGGEPIKHAPAFRAIQARVARAGAAAGVAYGDLVPGGRARPDGVELRWAVASAKKKKAGSSTSPDDGGDAWEPLEPGQLPFWCLDETPRRLRVPYEEKDGHTTHPTGIVGVAEVQVVVDEAGTADKAALDPVYDAVLGAKRGEGWAVDTLSGKELHPPSRVTLAAAGDAAVAGDLKISFYTNDKNWVGKTIGGKLDNGRTLEFHLVSAALNG